MRFKLLAALQIIATVTNGSCVHHCERMKTPETERAAQINRFLSSPANPLGDAATAAQMKEVLQRIATVAGVTDDLLVNTAVNKQKLNIYLTRSSSGLCEPANAYYDAVIDAIFVDVGILEPAVLSGTFASARAGGSIRKSEAEAYLRFIVLHELGHRQLHRDIALSGLSGDESKKLETEADDYALSTIISAFEAGGFSPASQAVAVSGKLRLPQGHNLTPKDIAIADLVSMIFRVTEGLLYSNAAYSPHTVDRFHPSFISRAERLLELAAQRALHPNITAYVKLAASHLLRLRAATPRLFAEIYCPTAIEVALHSEDAVIVVDHEGVIYRAALPDPAMLAPVRIDAHPIDSHPHVPQSSVRSALFHYRELGLLLFQPGRGLLVAQGSEWVDVSLPKTSPSQWTYVSTPISPARSFLAITEHRDKLGSRTDRTLTLIRGQSVTRSVSENRLIKSIRQQRPDLEVSALQTQWVGGFLFAALTDHASRQLGAAVRLDDDLRVAEILEFRMGSLGRGALILHAADRGAPPSCYYFDEEVDLYRPHQASYRLRAWALSRSGAPELLASHPLAIDDIPQGASPRDWLGYIHPSIVVASAIGSRGALVTSFMDSVYFFDYRSRQLQPALHPAGVHMRTSASGLALVYAPKGYKCYLLRF